MNRGHLWKQAAPTALGLLLATGLPAAVTGDEDAQLFVLETTVEVGVQGTDVDGDSAKFEEYRDLSPGLFIESLEVKGRARAHEHEQLVLLEAANVLKQDARYTLTFAIPGHLTIAFDYNKIPHRLANDARSVWSETDDGVFSLADPLRASVQQALEDQWTIDPSAIDHSFLSALVDPIIAAAGTLDLGIQRDRSHLRVELGAMETFDWTVDLKHENRRGSQAYGGSFGFFNATELPEPIDYDTTDAEIDAEWRGTSGGVRIGYRYSRFENNTGTLTWDNPFRFTDSTSSVAYLGPGALSVDGSSLGRADLAPDNRADSLFLDGRVTSGRVWAWASADYTVMTQDDQLVPYTTNEAIGPDSGAPFDATDPAVLPTDRADTEVQALSLNATLGARLGESGKLAFRYRYYDYDNASARVEFPGYVRFDSVWEEIGRITVPYAFTRQKAELELGWELGRENHLAVIAGRESWERTFREISDSDEDRLRITFDTFFLDWLTVRASFEHGDRSIGEYSTEAQFFSFLHPEEINNQPGLRKYDEADRTHDQFALTAELMPGDALFVSFQLGGREEEYAESELGLLSSDLLQYGAELSYNPRAELNFFLFAQREDRESLQRARQSGAVLSYDPANTWEAVLGEITDTVGLGLTSELSSRWRVELSANWIRADGEARFFTPPGGTPATSEDIENYDDIELLTAFVQIERTLSPRTTAGLGYRYEDYTVDSYLDQGLEAYLPGALLLNGNYGDYEAHVFLATFSWRAH